MTFDSAEYFGLGRTIGQFFRNTLLEGDLMYTLFLQYTIDPNKLEDWKVYAEAEFIPITESGGKITGYYAPTEFAGKTSEAFATIDVGTMAEYEVYRTKLAAHPKHKENVTKISSSGAIRSTYRAIIQRVEGGK